jgi:hypothetical protein
MKTFKLQHPSSREYPNIKLQEQVDAGLKFETWSFSGAWMLEFGAFFGDTP